MNLRSDRTLWTVATLLIVANGVGFVVADGPWRLAFNAVCIVALLVTVRLMALNQRNADSTNDRGGSA